MAGVPSDPNAFQLTPATLQGQDNQEAYHASRLLEMTGQLEKDFKKRNDLYKLIDKVVFLEQKVYIPEAYERSAVEVRSPFAFHICANITAALSINAPTVHFDPVGFGDSAEENQSLRQHFFEASWRRQEQEAKRRIFRLFTNSVVTKGQGIIKTVERKNRAWLSYNRFQKKLTADLKADDLLDNDSRDRLFDARTEEYKRGAPYPIASTDVPPESFYYMLGEDGYTMCAEIKDVPYYESLIRYKASLTRDGRVVPAAMGNAIPVDQCYQVMGKNQLLRMTEVWTWDEVTYILQGPGDKYGRGDAPKGQIVKRIKHRYGDRSLKTLYGPYFPCFGTTTASREVHKQGLSVIFAFLHLFPLLNSLLTIQSQAAFSFGFPSFKRTTPPGFMPGVEAPFGTDAAQSSASKEEVIPGGILPFDIAPVEMPRSGVDLDKAIMLTRSMIELALPDVAMGNISGDESGYAVNQAAHLAKLAWDPITDNMKFSLAERVEFESRIIEESVGEAVYVYGEDPRRALGRKPRRGTDGWLRMRPEDLNGVHRYTIELRSETPSNELLNLRAIAQKLQMRLVSPHSAIEAAGEDPHEVEMAWLLDDLKKDPAIRKQLQNRTFKKLATIDQQAMVGIEPPQGGTPALPGGGPAGPATVPVAPGAAPPIGPGPLPVNSRTAQPLAPLSQQQPGSGTPGVPPGAPGGVRNPPATHSAMPGDQG